MIWYFTELEGTHKGHQVQLLDFPLEEHSPCSGEQCCFQVSIREDGKMVPPFYSLVAPTRALQMDAREKAIVIFLHEPALVRWARSPLRKRT